MRGWCWAIRWATPVSHSPARRLPRSPRERELVPLVFKGLGRAEIAGALGLGEQSVKNALSLASRKLGVASLGELFHRVFPL